MDVVTTQAVKLGFAQAESGDREPCQVPQPDPRDL